ncbi:MAG: hydrogenase expression/formation protein HypE [Planctomycetes bacterium]|nr:hydrogenase expression/formation protein HypE [Planctomycetota bacterium]
MTDSKKENKILLAHGGGGRLTSHLIEKTILPAFSNDTLDKLTDAASLDLTSASVCMTTDSYVVKPLFFNGGDIGKLAVCGTVNDLAVAGATPVALSLSLIIEEGFDIDTLEKILASAGATAKQAGIDIVTGDTKVVEKGAADGLFINTAGLGTRHENADIDFDRVTKTDKIIINGTLGDHGMTIISQREGIKFDSPLQSDCAVLSGLIADVLNSGANVKFMRDPTRGGVAAVLNEIAAASGFTIELDEPSLPIDETVRAAADMLGFDLLDIANEGKVVFVVDEKDAGKVVDICKNHELGKKAAIIGEVLDKEESPVVELKTKIGGRRIVQMPYGRDLPRIC